MSDLRIIELIVPADRTIRTLTPVGIAVTSVCRHFDIVIDPIPVAIRMIVRLGGCASGVPASAGMSCVVIRRIGAPVVTRERYRFVLSVSAA